jgi:hypothetical protein|nr:MAG TPA: hypothetical protein [Caudoviricetes sp.]
MQSLAAFKIVNLTPHPVVVDVPGKNNRVGYRWTFKPSGKVARVKSTIREIGQGLFIQEFGELEGLPINTKDNAYYIVSSIVQQYCKANKLKVKTLCPFTSKAIKDTNGNIVSVPGFII